MSSISYGLIIVLLTWSNIATANDQNDLISPKSLLEKDTILKSSVEQDESLNKLTKRSIQSPQFNQLSYDYYYNQRYAQPAAPVQLSPYSMFPPWQPPVYQMNPPIYPVYPPVYQNNRPFYQDSRPYYGPPWNNFNGLPINIQPQSIYYNLGYPVDNPPNGFSPPVEGCQPQPCSNTNVKVPNRFGEDGPVWDRQPIIRPTRPTRRPGQGHLTPPPLIHNSHDTDEVTLAPPPSAIEPSKCVWAIVSCCSVASNQISYNCFEQLGCSGAFWDSNPCETEFARAAIANVMKYYQSKST